MTGIPGLDPLYECFPWESGAIHEEVSDSPDWCGVYSIWSKLEQKVCCKPHTRQENLKKALLREWHRFPMEMPHGKCPHTWRFLSFSMYLLVDELAILRSTKIYENLTESLH